MKRSGSWVLGILALAGCLSGGNVLAADPSVPAKPMREITLVSVDFEGTKVWVPGTLVAKKGDRVKLKLINRIMTGPNTHGFAIDDFGVKVVVARETPQSVVFTADKAGLFPFHCHLHPPHIGGEVPIPG